MGTEKKTAKVSKTDLIIGSHKIKTYGGIIYRLEEDYTNHLGHHFYAREALVMFTLGQFARIGDGLGAQAIIDFEIVEPNSQEPKEPEIPAFECIRPGCKGVARFEDTSNEIYPVRMSCDTCYLQTSEYVSKDRAWASWFQRAHDDYFEVVCGKVEG